MGLPDQSKYTIEELHERWVKLYGNCTIAQIENYVDQGILKMKTRHIDIFDGDVHIEGTKHIGVRHENYFTLSEIKRFETVYPHTVATSQQLISGPADDEMKTDETPVDFIVRRRSQGINERDIGLELYKQGLSKEKIGRSFYPNTAYHPSNYTKKADKILGLK